MTSFEEDYYAKYYRDYERQNPQRKLQHYVDTVAAELTGIAAPKVLDIGCAFGRFVDALDPTWERYGSDISNHAVACATTNVEGARFAVSREPTIPFDEKFDAITAWDVIEHIPALDELAGEVRARLVENGRFVFVVPVYDGPLGPIVRALDTDPTHIHKYSRRFWLEWAARHFELAKWWGLFRLLLPGGPYVHFPSRNLRSISPAILVVARAPRR